MGPPIFWDVSAPQQCNNSAHLGVPTVRDRPFLRVVRAPQRCNIRAFGSPYCTGRHVLGLCTRRGGVGVLFCAAVVYYFAHKCARAAAVYYCALGTLYW